MTVAENVAYGLRVKKVRGAERDERVRQALELVRLPDLGGRRPAELSGGQRQRVALARALVNRPRVLLLDEPLGALDLKLRQEMQTELRALQRQVGITFLHVTHDQEEALSMSDRLAVFKDGRIEQVGTPAEVYESPGSVFVAAFVGASNRLSGELARAASGSDSPVSRAAREDPPSPGLGSRDPGRVLAPGDDRRGDLPGPVHPLPGEHRRAGRARRPGPEPRGRLSRGARARLARRCASPGTPPTTAGSRTTPARAPLDPAALLCGPPPPPGARAPAPDRSPAALARRRVPRVPGGLAGAELLPPRRLHRPGGPAADPRHLARSRHATPPRHSASHPCDGHRRDPGRRAPGLSRSPTTWRATPRRGCAPFSPWPWSCRSGRATSFASTSGSSSSRRKEW